MQRLQAATGQHGAGDERADGQRTVDDKEGSEPGDGEGAHLRGRRADALSRGAVEVEAVAAGGATFLEAFVAPEDLGFHRHGLDGVDAAQSLDNEVEAPLIGGLAVVQRCPQALSDHDREDRKYDDESDRDENQWPGQIGDHRHEEDGEREVAEDQDRLSGVEFLQNGQPVQPLELSARSVSFAVDESGVEQAFHGHRAREVFEPRAHAPADIGPDLAEHGFQKQRRCHAHAQQH